MAKPSTFKFESAAYNKVLVILSFTMLLELRTQEGERGEWIIGEQVKQVERVDPVEPRTTTRQHQQPV